MLDDKNIEVSVSSRTGAVIIDSEDKISFEAALSKLQNKMGLTLKNTSSDEDGYMACLTV